MTSISTAAQPQPATGTRWWDTAVIYQIYPRSFADSNHDGIGDLPGITGRLDALRDLGVDAIWLSPFYVSPQNDAGYDVADYVDVDPLFGTLEDFDALVARAHALRLRVIVDLVPNHSSSEHAWFQEALASAPGSAERARYIFREGRGENGELPPNNWQSCFGGPAWTRVTEPDGTPGQWYLHLFDSSQPDFDWANPWVRRQFEEILRFWLRRGVDGFRVDVAHGLVKDPALPDHPAQPAQGEDAAAAVSTADFFASTPYWGQDGVHEIYRRWREVLAEFGDDKILCAEAWVGPMAKLAEWVRPDEMHQAFNFSFLGTPWDARELRSVIDESLSSFGGVGAPSTWVLSNHDVVRHTTRLSLASSLTAGYGIGPATPGLPEPEPALARARAATALMLALPGSSYLYQGEELGLPEVIDIADQERQDPAWVRTAGERYGRDGCRVPIPWESEAPGYGFNGSGRSWLPLPSEWRLLARDVQQGDPASTLEMYRSALAIRRARGLGGGALEWIDVQLPNVLAFRNGDLIVVTNFGPEPISLPGGTVVLASRPGVRTLLPMDTTAWLLPESPAGAAI